MDSFSSHEGGFIKKDTSFQMNKKIIFTLFVMLALIGLSLVVSYHISRLEEQACWDILHQSADQIASDMVGHINSDQELLESIADIIKQQDSIDSPDVQNIIDTFRPHTMMSHIALLLPGDQIMLPNEPIRDTGGIVSFEEEAALGRHVSDRSVDIRDESRAILRNFVPVVQDGKTVAMLYGVIDLETLPDQWETTAYDGQAAVYIADGKTGDFIMDTWHRSLGNIMDLGDREAKRGYSHAQLQQDILNGKTGYCVFASSTTGDYLYYYYQPIAINQWMVGISVSEDLAFERLHQINYLLLVFNIVEIVLLVGYFIWMIQSTRRELCEKQRLAETDVLTGLLNRNSYEEKLTSYPAGCRENLTCIYADVNGLHELNNSSGHAAGDKMLQTVAHTIQCHFGTGDTYRIGGDEFVAFVRDEAEETIQAQIGEIIAFLEKEGYHVSVGICRQEAPIEMDAMIKQAEKNMYIEKNRYYEQIGVDRRRRT